MSFDSTTMPFPSRSLTWSHGSAEVWALSGALHYLDLTWITLRR